MARWFSLIVVLVGVPALILLTPALSNWLGLVLGAVVAQALMVGLLALVALRLHRIDGAAIGEFGFQGTGWWTPVFTLLIGAFLFLGYRVIAFIVHQQLGFTSALDGADPFYDLPLALQISDIVILTGIADWMIFAFAAQRIVQLTGSRAMAFILSLLVFVLPHWPHWGDGPTLTLFVSSTLLMAYMFWRKDIVALVLADLGVDIYNAWQVSLW